MLLYTGDTVYKFHRINSRQILNLNVKNVELLEDTRETRALRVWRICLLYINKTFPKRSPAPNALHRCSPWSEGKQAAGQSLGRTTQKHAPFCAWPLIPTQVGKDPSNRLLRSSRPLYPLWGKRPLIHHDRPLFPLLPVWGQQLLTHHGAVAKLARTLLQGSPQFSTPDNFLLPQQRIRAWSP